MTRLRAERLPGWDEFAAADPKVQPYLDQLGNKVEASIRDGNWVAFEKDLDSVVLAWERINERLAEVYRAAHPDAADWELRYVKWMKIGYIRFESALGDLYLIPRETSRKPIGVSWCTAEEMMDWLHPTVAAAINMSGAWPPRDLKFRSPGPGEKVLRIDAANGGMKATFEIGKARRYG